MNGLLLAFVLVFALTLVCGFIGSLVAMHRDVVGEREWRHAMETLGVDRDG
jgi:hypothetical protein